MKSWENGIDGDDVRSDGAEAPARKYSIFGRMDRLFLEVEHARHAFMKTVYKKLACVTHMYSFDKAQPLPVSPPR